MTPSWDRYGPRADERVLAGRIAGVLWLSVLPMVLVGLVLPGTESAQALLILLITLPATVWGALCLFVIPWERVTTPLVFHVPSVLALGYIGVLVGATGTAGSPFAFTFLMLLVFCACFYPPPVAIAYVCASLVTLAAPLAYDPGATGSGLLGQLWVSTVVFGSVAGVVLVGKRQLVALRDAAEDRSLRDSLTGLANRRALQELLDGHDAETRHKEAIGFLLMDLDNFKEVNTRYGMEGGDLALCAVAGALREVSREGQLVVRLGGDEFAIVATGLPPQAMERLADRALESVRQSLIDVELPGVHVSASAGWAVCPYDADSAGELVGVADLALRAAKLDGKERARGPLEWAREAR
jgi:diguanylate cyclase (GGDEF)-like protein